MSDERRYHRWPAGLLAPLLLVGLALAACMQREAQPVAETTTADATLTCAGIDAEIKAIRWKSLARYAELTGVQRGNVAFLALLVVDPSMLAGLASSEPATAELAAYRRRYDGLVGQWKRRPCPGDPVGFPAPSDIEHIQAKRAQADTGALRVQIATVQGVWRGLGDPVAAASGSAASDCPELKFVMKVSGQSVTGYARDDSASRRVNISGYIHPNGDLWETSLGSFPLNGSIEQGVYRMDDCIGEYRLKREQSR